MKRIFKIMALLIVGLSFQSASAATPLKKILAPENAVDIASINVWKPEMPIISPIQNSTVATIDNNEPPEFVRDMIAYAHDFIGTRYRRGGKQPGGFDCSGFTGYIFGQFGISLNANSGSQYTQGDAVNSEELRPGDLVFFAGGRGNKSRVGHVGIVNKVNADGTFNFIHASSSRGITISESTEPYYHKRFIGARRVATGD